MLQSSLAVFRYELKKSFGIGPTIFWLCVIVFPTILQLLIDHTGYTFPEEFSGVLLVGMIPGAVCLMTILSSMAPYLNTELEGNTWPYVATRPHGRTAMMLGKYFVSITRSIIAGFLALVIIFPATSLNKLNRDIPPPISISENTTGTVNASQEPDGTAEVKAIVVDRDEPYPLWVSLSILVVLSSVCYSSLFCLLGTIMHKKPMILAIIYTLLVEGVISMLPAVVNAFTINFYLRSMFLRFMGWNLTDLPNELSFINDPNMFSQATSFWDFVSLLVLCTGFMLIANALLRNREYHVGETL
mgnify:CR=1 FL=1